MHIDAKELDALLSVPLARSVQHLLTCARCRRRMTLLLLDLDPPDEEFALGNDAKGESPGVPPATLETLLLRAIALVEREGEPTSTSSESRLGVLHLLAVPPHLRLEAIATQAHFRDLGVAEILLEKARETSADEPLQTRQLAILATAILDTFDRTTKEERLLAEASCLLGDAERRLGNLDLAEDFFKDAAFGLRDQPLLLRVRVVLSRLWAALRQEQRRVDEALALLEHASTLAEELGHLRELALSQLAYGWLLLDEFDTERALLPLRETLSFFDPKRDPRSVLSALHALALAYAELGDESQLAQTLSSLDDLASHLNDPLDPLRIRWIRVRASWRLREYDGAISELGEIFEALTEEGSGSEAAMAGLELARMEAERDQEPLRLSRTLAWISTRLQALSPEQLPSYMLPVLRFALRFPARREGAYLDVLLAASSYVERARFNPKYPFYPTPQPERTLVWNDLTRAQRRRAAQTAGVELDSACYARSQEDLLVISWTHEALTGVRIQIPHLTEDDDTRPG